jgi:hypothetical protein
LIKLNEYEAMFSFDSVNPEIAKPFTFEIRDDISLYSDIISDDKKAGDNEHELSDEPSSPTSTQHSSNSYADMSKEEDNILADAPEAAEHEAQDRMIQDEYDAILYYDRSEDEVKTEEHFIAADGSASPNKEAVIQEVARDMNRMNAISISHRNRHPKPLLSNEADKYRSPRQSPLDKKELKVHLQNNAQPSTYENNIASQPDMYSNSRADADRGNVDQMPRRNMQQSPTRLEADDSKSYDKKRRSRRSKAHDLDLSAVYVNEATASSAIDEKAHRKRVPAQRSDDRRTILNEVAKPEAATRSSNQKNLSPTSKAKKTTEDANISFKSQFSSLFKSKQPKQPKNLGDTHKLTKPMDDLPLLFGAPLQIVCNRWKDPSKLIFRQCIEYLDATGI